MEKIKSWMGRERNMRDGRRKKDFMFLFYMSFLSQASETHTRDGGKKKDFMLPGGSHLLVRGKTYRADIQDICSRGRGKVY